MIKYNYIKYNLYFQKSMLCKKKCDEKVVTSSYKKLTMRRSSLHKMLIDNSLSLSLSFVI